MCSALLCGPKEPRGVDFPLLSSNLKHKTVFKVRRFNLLLATKISTLSTTRSRICKPEFSATACWAPHHLFSFRMLQPQPLSSPIKIKFYKKYLTNNFFFPKIPEIIWHWVSKHLIRSKKLNLPILIESKRSWKLIGKTRCRPRKLDNQMNLL